MTSPQNFIDYQALVDSLGQGVLLFTVDGELVLDNLAARTILGNNLILIRSEGWPALALLLDGPRESGTTTDQLREQALRSAVPIRFHTYFSGAYIPCWITTVYSANGTIFIMVVIDQPDWQALTELLGTFRTEARMAISATQGHAELIRQILQKSEETGNVKDLPRRVHGFTDIISTHMLRLQTLMELLQRLEVIRIGALRDQVRTARRKLRLADFIEDFLEEMADETIADPDMGGSDLRDRLTLDVPDHLEVLVTRQFLRYALHDVLRNALYYSPPDSPITLQAAEDMLGHHVQIEISDEGCGIREKEQDRVFQPFQRARQPQVIAVDGYGLSLYLTKAELEAMGGKIWFESVEGSGTTFFIKLPTMYPRESRY